jgi:autonomous glycyl radical cofactor GrcA
MNCHQTNVTQNNSIQILGDVNNLFDNSFWELNETKEELDRFEAYMDLVSKMLLNISTLNNDNSNLIDTNRVKKN